MKDLKDLKVGDKVWTIQEGWTEIVKIEDAISYKIRTKLNIYSEKGMFINTDLNPSLFLTNPYELILSMQEIADKFGVDVETLKIQK